MATSSTYSFDPDFLTIAEQVYEDAGLEVKTGYDLVQLRRTLNLMLNEWANEGLSLWVIEENTLSLVDGTSSYTLPSKYHDVLDVAVRDSNNLDRSIDRYTMQEYLKMPNKSTESSVVAYTIFRNATPITLKVWPTPSDSTHTLVYYGIRHHQDVGNYTNTVDLPRRFLPVLIAGLAYKLACKRPMADNPEVEKMRAAKRMELKANYQELFQKAKDEDREKTDFVVTFSRR